MYLQMIALTVVILLVVFFGALILFTLVDLENAAAWATIVTLLVAAYLSFGWGD